MPNTPESTTNRTQPPALTEFLRARIAEDEALARAALDEWVALHGHGTPAKWTSKRQWSGERQPGITDFKRLNGPDRVLAECEAKRRIVEFAMENATHNAMRQLEAGEVPDRTEFYPVALLAKVYADHPDYDEAWRP